MEQIIFYAGLMKRENQWETFYGVLNAYAVHGWDITIHATVTLKSQTGVPSISFSGIPRSTVFGIFLGNKTGTTGSKRFFVIVKHTTECLIRRKFGIEATIAKDIQRDCCLRKKLIPLFVPVLGI